MNNEAIKLIDNILQHVQTCANGVFLTTSPEQIRKWGLEARALLRAEPVEATGISTKPVVSHILLNNIHKPTCETCGGSGEVHKRRERPTKTSNWEKVPCPDCPKEPKPDVVETKWHKHIWLYCAYHGKCELKEQIAELQRRLATKEIDGKVCKDPEECERILK